VSHGLEYLGQLLQDTDNDYPRSHYKYFGSGNAVLRLQNFATEHRCNKYCRAFEIFGDFNYNALDEMSREDAHEWGLQL
jgi:hypothetical protein